MTPPTTYPGQARVRATSAALGRALGRAVRWAHLDGLVVPAALRVLRHLDPGHEVLARAEAHRSTLSGADTTRTPLVGAHGLPCLCTRIGHTPGHEHLVGCARRPRATDPLLAEVDRRIAQAEAREQARLVGRTCPPVDRRRPRGARP